jgi:hypothetical protein
MGLGSGIRDPRSGGGGPGETSEETYSGSRIQGSKEHRIPNPGYATLFTGKQFLKGTKRWGKGGRD